MAYELTERDQAYVQRAADHVRELENAGNGDDDQMIGRMREFLAKARQQREAAERDEALFTAILNELGEL